MEVDEHFPFSILETDEAHFLLNGDINTHNFRIWAKQVPHVIPSVSMDFSKVNGWCGVTASVRFGPFSLKSKSTSRTVTNTVTAARLEFSLSLFVKPGLEKRVILDTMIFMHTDTCIKQLLNQHFTDDRIISRNLHISFLPRS
ncbi:hypothetical protein AVEN_217319-1 [Araneus ventricosus]|uniref:Uncharacterized protein n=1 Tax=Araneus ventricosus TaxID=182803 RepID=A0A4Y2JML1_ARAVE|nr:hypothetical protein AVEN_217319-1 [Araneus ventricosus]